MKITHILKNARIGGVQKFVSSLILSETDDSYKHSVILTRGRGDFKNSVNLARVKTTAIPAITHPFRPDRLYVFGKRVFKLVYRFFFFIHVVYHHPDVLNSHLDDYQEVAAHLDVCRLLRIPVVWTMHGLLQAHAPGFASLEKAIKRANRVSLPVFFIYVGEKPPVLESLALTNTKVVHIPSGINLRGFPDHHSARLASRKKNGVGEDEIVIAYIGRLGKEKGVDILIQAVGIAIKQETKFRLFILGEGAERKVLESMVSEMGLSNVVSFHGTINNIPEVLPMFDACVLPSRTEGLPITMLEAIASRVPVVATAVGGIPDLIDNNITGLLVSPENQVQLSEAIMRMVKDDHLRAQCADAAYDRVKEYDIQKVLEKYHTVYNQVSGQSI